MMNKKPKPKNFEIAITVALARHSIPTAFVDCLLDTLKLHITDSEILKKVKIGRTKASYMTEFGLGEKYEQETIKKLKECVAFGISFDESEVNKISELEILVNIASKDGTVEARHYCCLDLAAGDAETIKTFIFDQFEEDGINYKDKLIDLATDGCPTMIGIRGGVLWSSHERQYFDCTE